MSVVDTLNHLVLLGARGSHAALIPPELLDPTVDQEVRDRAAEWSRLGFEIRDSSGADITTRVVLNEAGGAERPIGEFAFRFELARPSRLSWSVAGTPEPRADREKFSEVEAVLDWHPGWLKVWYDSGHTLVDETVVALRYRDEAFDGYVWENLHDTNVKREKPDPLAAVGTQDSLFCWVKNYWRTRGAGPAPRARGWLACDDGSMEMADFIHLDLDTKPPTLALIHVKASKSKEADRPISVSDYEIVTGQAVKNLRYLDGLIVGEGLEAGLKKKIGKLVSEDGAPANRAGFIAVLGAVGSNYQRLVVIVQPRATRTAVEQARANRGSSEHARLTQLDTLLLGARANCQSLGARLEVVGEDTTAAPAIRHRRTP